MAKSVPIKVQGRKQNSRRKIRFYIKNHVKAAWNSYSQLLQTPFATLTTCLVMAMAMVLTATLLITVTTFQHLAQKINASNQFTLYLKPHPNSADLQQFIAEVKRQPLARTVTYISAQQALKELTEQADYRDILTNIEDNPLPPVLLIKFNATEKEQVQRYLTQLKHNNLISTIHLDFEWVQRLLTIITLANRFAYALALFISLALIFIVSHAIAAATQKNQQEIYLLQLIGAPIAYIRRPLLYMGALLGLGAGCLTLIFLLALLLLLKAPLVSLLNTYNYQLPLLIDSRTVGQVLAFSAALGWIGAVIAFYKYAKLL